MKKLMIAPLALLASPAFAQDSEEACREIVEVYTSGAEWTAESVVATDEGYCEVTGYSSEGFITETADFVRFKVVGGTRDGDGGYEIPPERVELSAENFTGGFIAGQSVVNVDLVYTVDWDGGVFGLEVANLEADSPTLDVTVSGSGEARLPEGVSADDAGAGEQLELVSLDVDAAFSGECGEMMSMLALAPMMTAELGPWPDALLGFLPDGSFDAETKAELTEFLTTEDLASCPQPMQIEVSGEPLALYGAWIDGGAPNPALIAEAFDGVDVDFIYGE